MLKRLHIYFKEMYPIIPRLFLGLIVFFEIYFVLLLNYGVTQFSFTAAEFVGSYTIFAFLLFLRVADDFKDRESDKKLFPDRPLPSGKVRESDLIIAVSFFMLAAIVLNILFMNNLPFFILLLIYGALMSVWFFKKAKISKSLPLALLTHNPVQMIMNIYIISFACIKYSLKPFTLSSFLVAMTLYFPALIWEISRKIRAPHEETEYTTYSKLFGYQKSTRFVMILTLVDIITNILLLWKISRIGVGVLVINVAWITWMFIKYIKKPNFVLVKKVERYTYITELTMMLSVGFYLLRLGLK